MLAPLFERFSRAAIDAGATVEQIPRSSTALASAIRRVTGEARRMAFADAIDLPSDLFEECRRAANVVTARSRIELSSLDAGITEAFAGIARTGSVADKSDKSALLAAIRMALQVESSAVRHNTQSFNRGRYAATSAIPDYETLKDKARAIKEDSLARLPELLAALEASVSRNGGHFHLAPTAADASRYVAEVCREAGVRLVVKGKSMTSEEIGLNRTLDALGIQVVETDLAEFILQVADEQPSHIIAPAIHYSRERITALFKRSFRTDLPLATGEELTAFARGRLREKFLQADAGITGANFIAADSGTLVLVESEANIRMASLLPPLHIAIAGVEKIVPSRKDFGPFLELLAASATGQPMTSYTSVISPPLKAAPVLAEGDAPPRQFQLVLVDHRRLNLGRDEGLREALYCLRCRTCLHSCL